MEKQFSKEEVLMKKWMQEAGLEQPSSKFTMDLLKTIEIRNKPLPVYEPLISKNAWILIGLFGVCFIGAMSLVVSDINWWQINMLTDFEMPSIQLSSMMVYAIALVSLFVLEIPFLNKLLEKQQRYNA